MREGVPGAGRPLQSHWLGEAVTVVPVSTVSVHALARWQGSWRSPAWGSALCDFVGACACEALGPPEHKVAGVLAEHRMQVAQLWEATRARLVSAVQMHAVSGEVLCYCAGGCICERLLGL